MSDSTENTNELDSYGVWVKNTQDEIEAPVTADATEELNFSDSLDLPEFDETPVTDDDDLNIFENTPSLENTLDPSSEDTTLNTDELMNITNGVDIVETDETGHNPDETDDLNFNLGSGDEVKLEDNISDLSFDEPVIEETSVTEPEAEPAVEDLSFDIPTEEPVIEDASFDLPSMDVVTDGVTAGDTAEPIADISEDSTFDIPTDIPSEETIESAPGADSEGETELSLDDFMDGGFSDESVAAGNNGYEPGAEGSPSAAGSEEVSLDDFLDGGFEEEKKEEEQIVDEKPLEMDISFDSAADSVQTEENTSINDDFDDEDEDPIETAYEEAGIQTDDTIAAEPVAEESSGITSAPTESFDSEEVDLSDFGIDADAEETPVTQDVAEAKNIEKVVDYDLSVSNETTSSAPVVNVIRDNNEKIEEMQEVEDLQPVPSDSGTSTVDNSLLRQIVDDLSNLKSEISRLKTDLAEAKDKQPSEDMNFESLGIEETKDEGGFFGGDDGDDTIALSNDELNNIMTTADFNSVDEPAITDDTPVDVVDNAEPEFEETAVDASETISDEENFGLSMEKDTLSEEFAENIENETLIEPNLDSIEETTDDTVLQEELPSEISIPKDDDILVESSSTDYIDDLNSNKPDTEPTLTGELDSGSDDATETFTDVFDQPAEAPEETDVFGSVDAPFATDETKTEISESNLDYLTSESKPGDSTNSDNNELKKDIKSVLLYMDQLLENLPEDKIVEFAKSEEFTTYKKLFSELGLS